MVLNIVMCRIKLKRIGITQEQSKHSVRCYPETEGVLLVVILTKDYNMKDWEKYIYKF